MGHLKDIANQPKLQSFPSAQFEIAGDIPAAQCSEAKIESDAGRTIDHLGFLVHTDKFIGWNLAGKKCTITFSNGGNTGTWTIASNTDHDLDLGPGLGNGNPVTYYVHNGGELILTRNIQSFANFISAAGYAYTIKGAKLYTNIPTAQLQPACSILFDPLS